MSEEEEYLLKMLAMLQESYAKAARPYVDRLVTLRSYAVRPHVIVSGRRCGTATLQAMYDMLEVQSGVAYRTFIDPDTQAVIHEQLDPTE